VHYNTGWQVPFSTLRQFAVAAVPLAQLEGPLPKHRGNAIKLFLKVLHEV
jgi:hypothetical protein